VLPGLIDEVIKSNSMTGAGAAATIAIGKLFADGSYNSDIIFRFLADSEIQPCVKVRKI
jgi:hypothetical protein